VWKEAPGFANAGYFHCEAPRNKWIHNGDEIVGSHGSNQGFQVALSQSGKMMAVAGLWLDQDIRVFDKDGPSGNLAVPSSTKASPRTQLPQLATIIS